MKQTKYALVVFGLGGFHAHSADGNSTLSGYDSPDQFGHNDRDRAQCEGATIVDLCELAERDPGAVLRLPLVRTTLADNQIERFADLCKGREFFVSAVAEDPTFRGMIALGLADTPEQEPGALDSVSVAAYVALVARKGARVGRFTRGRCQWGQS